MHRRFGRSPDSTEADPDQDKTLVIRIAAGDEQAFEEFYVLYRRRLARFLGRFVNSADTVDELINDVMFVVWQEAVRFECRSRVSTWVFGIAWHKALKALERQKRSSARSGLALDNLPSTERGNVEERDWLRRGLDKLSSEQRLVVELTFFAGCSYEEIAAIAHCPINTVKTRMFYARQKLQHILKSLDATHAEDRP